MDFEKEAVKAVDAIALAIDQATGVDEVAFLAVRESA